MGRGVHADLFLFRFLLVPLLASTKLHDLCPCFCRSQDLMLYGRSLSLYKRATASAARSYLLPQYLIGTGITNTFVLPNNVLNRINSSSIIGIDSFCKTADRPCFLSRSQFCQNCRRHFQRKLAAVFALLSSQLYLVLLLVLFWYWYYLYVAVAPDRYIPVRMYLVAVHVDLSARPSRFNSSNLWCCPAWCGVLKVGC